LYDIVWGARGFWVDLKWGAGGFWTNLKWMFFTMLAPEFILGKAIGDFVAVWKLKNKKEEYAVKDNVEWGLSHGFFANMGGFRVILVDDSQQLDTQGSGKLQENKESPQASDPAIELDENPLEQARISEMTEPPKGASDSTPEMDGQDIVNSYILSGETIYSLRHPWGIKLPGITTAEIHDKGKANVFVKVLAVIQVFWICVQVIVRSARGLTVSQLELVVTAFSLCAIITYQFLIPKPQGVQVPMRPMKLDRIHFDCTSGRNLFALRTLVLPGLDAPGIKDPPSTRVPNDFVPKGDQAAYALGMTLGGLVFGGIHIAGWHLSFPTSIEQDPWRIFSILMTCLLPIALLPYILIGIDLDPLLAGISGNFIQAWGFVFGIYYIVVRLFLLVETFRTLVYLPPDAFVSTWVSNIPYVG
jgi:hypothetical protein